MGSENREYSFNPKDWEYKPSRHNPVLESIFGKMPENSNHVYHLNYNQTQDYLSLAGFELPPHTSPGAQMYSGPETVKLIRRVTGKLVAPVGILMFDNNNALRLAHEMAHLKQYEEKSPYWSDNFLRESLADVYSMAFYIKLNPYEASYRRYYRIVNGDKLNHTTNDIVDGSNSNRSPDDPYHIQWIWDTLTHYLQEKYTPQTVRKLNSEDMEEVERRIVEDVNRNGRRR